MTSGIASRALLSAATVLVLGSLLVGCGHGGSTSSTRSSPTPTTDAGAAGASSNRAVAQAVATCKRTVRTAPLLSNDEKGKLTALCDKAASGDLAGAKRVAIAVCHDITGSLPEFARTQAQAVCPTT